MKFLNSRRDSYEELFPSSRGKCHPSVTFRTMLSSLAVVALCVVVIVLLVQVFSSDDPEDSNASLLAANSISEDDVIAKMELGQIRGTKLTSRDGRSYLAFLGVPYAKPPMRFTQSEELDAPWEGTLDATEFKPQCMQAHQSMETGIEAAVGSEDCLFLNVYTPKTPRDLGKRRNRFPVIVYLHGGKNGGNASQYGADYFMDEDVVLVMVNYRVHVFGNLNTGDSAARGNFATKDQVTAMKWIQANIGAFGGDKRKVTLYGLSFGSIMISAHLLSPMSKGLFHGAIMQSGTLLSMKNKDAGRQEAEKLAAMVNCPVNDSFAMVDCFRNTSGELLTLGASNLNFAVTIEPESENASEDTCVPDAPLKLIESGKFTSSVPTIHGVTSSESLITALIYLLSLNESSISANVSDSKKNEEVLNLMQFEHAQNPEVIAQAIRDYYFQPWNRTRDILRQNLTNLLTDRDWLHPMSVYVRNQLKARSQKDSIFLYYFSKESSYSYANTFKESFGESSVPFGVQHADDLQFFFAHQKYPRIMPGSENYNFSKFIIRAWVNFAKTGKPTNDGDEVEWKALDPKDDDSVPLNWFELNDNPKMFQPYGVHDRIKFWDTFNLTDLYV